MCQVTYLLHTPQFSRLPQCHLAQYDRYNFPRLIFPLYLFLMSHHLQLSSESLHLDQLFLSLSSR